MAKLRRMALVALAVASLSPLYGCGAECADGTTDRDGQCVVAARGCAEGTALRDGECRLDNSGCGENTTLEDGQCVPVAEVCEGEATFDEDEQVCVPSTDVICGAGTVVGEAGFCVPGEDACSDKTRLDDNGRCVVAAASCGEGTALDPNTGECVLAEEACGAGLAFDAGSDRCVPTEDVCELGTVFDVDSGLCLNDSCSLGDVLIDGVCMSPAEDLLDEVDGTETENNDPALGGTAEALTVAPSGDNPYVFSGAIGAPSDLDGDGDLDQDVDVYEFEANAGEWLEISIRSLGLQAPAFVIEGPEDYMRYSPIGRARDATREMVAPASGSYTLTVLPSINLQSNGAITNVGSDDWTYVGTIQLLDSPDATQLDLSAGEASLRGDYMDLRDNLFELTGIASSDLVSVKVASSGADADGLLQQWESPRVVSAQDLLSTGAAIDVSANAGSALLLFDWTRLDGPTSDFDVTAKIVGAQETLTLLPGTTKKFEVSADDFHHVVAGQSNPSDVALDVRITDSTNTEVAAGALSSNDELRHLAESADTFTVTFANTSANQVDATLVARAVGPPTLGPLRVWNTLTYSSPGIVPVGEIRLHEVIVDEAGTLGFELKASDPYESTALTLFDSTMNEVAPAGDRALTLPAISPGTYYLHVEPERYSVSYDLRASLFGSPDFSSAPAMSIPDSTVPGVSDVLSVSGCATISSIEVYVDITHTYRGDIVMTLSNPDGTSVLLHDGTGAGADNLLALYPVTRTPEESISAFVGGSGTGDWTLTVGDEFNSDTGMVTEWGLNLGCQ